MRLLGHGVLQLIVLLRLLWLCLSFALVLLWLWFCSGFGFALALLLLWLCSGFALAFDLDLRRPVKPRWPNAGLNPWVTRQDAGLAVLGQGWPMTAAHGFKPGFGHTEPRRGAEWWGKSPFGYFWGSFPKVTRCKSGTLSGRYRSNGYVPIPTQHPGRPRGRHRGQAPSHI